VSRFALGFSLAALLHCLMLLPREGAQRTKVPAKSIEEIVDEPIFSEWEPVGACKPLNGHLPCRPTIFIGGAVPQTP